MVALIMRTSELTTVENTHSIYSPGEYSSLPLKWFIEHRQKLTNDFTWKSPDLNVNVELKTNLSDDLLYK